jgi:hypothetical protein
VSGRQEKEKGDRGGDMGTYTICKDSCKGRGHTANEVEDRVPLADLIYTA